MKSEDQYQAYLENGFCVFGHDQQILNWVEHALPFARNAVNAEQNKHWFRHAKTWFVGVNVLANNSRGQINKGPALRGKAIDFIETCVSKAPIKVDKAQVSVCYPGYPQASNDESQAAFGYRLRRDAAHVDGIMKIDGDRFLVEHHEFILALAMTQFSHDASPFVAWRGSHRIMQNALHSFLKDYSAERWGTIPITHVYNQARKQVFEQCERLEFSLTPGQALIGHRHLLHGTAPWQPTASADEDGRMICFFRPENLSLEQWLTQLE